MGSAFSATMVLPRLISISAVVAVHCQVALADPAVTSSMTDSTCANKGHCGLAYEACCAGFIAKGFPCGCHLKDGNGGADSDCGTCGTAYSVCCAAYKAKGAPCTCDIRDGGMSKSVVV